MDYLFYNFYTFHNVLTLRKILFSKLGKLKHKKAKKISRKTMSKLNWFFWCIWELIYVWQFPFLVLKLPPTIGSKVHSRFWLSQGMSSASEHWINKILLGLLIKVPRGNQKSRDTNCQRGEIERAWCPIAVQNKNLSSFHQILMFAILSQFKRVRYF